MEVRGGLGMGVIGFVGKISYFFGEWERFRRILGDFSIIMLTFAANSARRLMRRRAYLNRN